MTDGIELRHLRYFVALAGERHFGRAAESLGVSQPLLSRQVRELERMVGVPLLARTRPVVELSPPGREFFLHAQQTLRQAEGAVRAAHRAGGETNAVVIAFEPCSVFHGFDRLAAKSVKHVPDLRLDIREFPVPEHANRLRSGEVDIAFAHRNEDAPDIEFVSFGWEPLNAVVPASHRLARRRMVSPRDLAGEPFIFWRRSIAPACHDYIERLLASNGVEARPRHLASDHRNALELVASGLGWAIAPQCARRVGQARVAFREIAGARIEFGISHLKAGLGGQVRELVRMWAEVGRGPGNQGAKSKMAAGWEGSSPRAMRKRSGRS